MDGLNDTAIGELALPAAATLGFPVLTSRFSRAYIDLNRHKAELDPLLIDGIAPQVDPASRVAAGLGLIPRLGTGQVPLYQRKLSHAAVQSRIKRAYDPYHKKLQSLIEACLAEFGTCLLIDLHSMPPVLPALARRALAATPGQPCMAKQAYKASPLNLVLGDDMQRTLGSVFSARCLRFFQARGLTIAYNHPYSGGYITQFYGRQVPTLQLEICRSLYVGSVASVHSKALERLFLDFCRAITSQQTLLEAAE